MPIRFESTSLRLAFAGVAHGHIKFFSRSPFYRNVDLAGVSEIDDALRAKYGRQNELSDEILFVDLEEMLDRTRPEAVCAFGPTSDHLAVVRAAAPRGIHVMVEKPLAASVTDALEMAALARQHNIHLLTNYETSWYPSTTRILDDVASDQFGKVHKVVFHHGHAGPVHLGCEPEFVDWLTDPARPGSGALFDFGCYGANIMTRMNGGRAPDSVTAFVRQVRPDIYPHVEDDAAIVLHYPSADAFIFASWAWPVARKDIEVYGSKGQSMALDGRTMTRRAIDTPNIEQREVLPSAPIVWADPFAHLAAVIRGEIALDENDLSGLNNNLLVVRILQAAHLSASQKRTVSLAEIQDA